MNKLQSNNVMPLVTVEENTLLICFSQEEKPLPSEGDGEAVTMYEYEYVRVEKTASYPQIIRAIIRERYPQDEVEALISNSLKKTKTEEEKLELEVFQKWREFAKTTAREVLNR